MQGIYYERLSWIRGELLFWWLVLCCLTHLCLTADFVSWFLCFFIAEILGHRLDEHCILDEAWWLNWWNEWNSQLWTVWNWPSQMNQNSFQALFFKSSQFLTHIYIYSMYIHTSISTQVGRIWEVSLQDSLSDSGFNTWSLFHVAAAIGCGSCGEKRGGGVAHLGGEKNRA